jgi:hypothetical protein
MTETAIIMAIDTTIENNVVVDAAARGDLSFTAVVGLISLMLLFLLIL